MEGFKFKHSLQLRYSDFDMLGHLNSATYATLLELGRIEYYLNINWNLKEISNVVASFKIDYLNEIKPGREVDVWVKISKLGNKSFKMEYLLASSNETTIYAKAETTQVCIQRKDNSSTPIPTEIKQAVSQFEGI